MWGVDVRPARAGNRRDTAISRNSVPVTEPASPIAGLRQRYDDLPPEWRQRIPALALALAVEILLVLVLLSLGSVKREVVARTDTLVAFTTSSQDEEEAVADAPTPAEIPEAAQPQVSQTQSSLPSEVNR